MASENHSQISHFEENIPPWKKELLQRKKLLSKGKNVWSVQLTNKYGADDFHSVRNMRLLKSQEAKSDYHFVNTSDSKSSRMVEDKISSKRVSSSKAMNKLKADYLSKIKNLESNGKSDVDGNSDSSEELQYGPGIVNKLKSKYLSMTLRDNQRYSGRPSLANLRRATSLENMLDNENDLTGGAAVSGASNSRHFLKKQSSGSISASGAWTKGHRISHHHAKYLGISSLRVAGSGESMKRARSMDTLFKNDIHKPAVVRPNGMTQSVIANEDLVIVDRDTEFPTCKSCIPDDKELPPPDVVKQTKKIFEKPSDGSNEKRNKKTVLNKVGNNSVKVGTVFEKQTERTKPLLSPKPVFSGDSKLPPKGNAPGNSGWSGKKIYPLVTSARGPTSPVKLAPTSPLSSTPVASSSPRLNIASRPDAARIVAMEPKTTLPPFVSIKPSQSGTGSGGNSPLLSSVRSSPTPMSPIISSPALSPVRSSPVMQYSGKLLLDDDNYDRSPDDSVSSTSSNPKELIVSNLSSPKYHQGQDSIGCYLPRRNLVTPQATNPCLVKSQAPDPPPTSVVKQVAVIRPIPSKKPLTDQEVENNLINAVKSIKKSIDDGHVTVDGGVSDSEQVQQAWEKKSWQNTNTMIFNFSSRQTVPDYIENDGIHSTNRTSSKDTNNRGDEVDLDDEWEAQLFSEVSFIGDNVLINGKSSFRKDPNPNKARRIKFNDEATTLYEYPSEDSLIEDQLMSDSPSPRSSPLPNSPLGGATLQKYTPCKSPTPTGFELGVTSPAPAQTTSQHSSQQPSKPSEPNYLKPVDIDQEMAWSQETASDILF